MLLLLILFAQAIPQIRPERYLLVERDARYRPPEMPLTAAIPSIPPELLAQDRASSILLQLEVDESGRAVRAKVLDRDDAAAQGPAMLAALHWHLGPTTQPGLRSIRLAITFRPMPVQSVPDELLTTVRGETDVCESEDGKTRSCPKYLIEVRARTTGSAKR